MRTKRLLVAGIAVVFALLLSACNRDPEIQKRKFYAKGVAYLQKGRVSDAKLQFMNAVRLDQTYAEADTTLAEIYFRENNYKPAYQLLKQALQGNPEYLPAHKGIAQFDRLMGKYAEAQKEIAFVLERSPNDPDAMLKMGTLLALQGKPDEAAARFQKVLELQPGEPGALLELASLSENRNDRPAAERFMKTALEKNPRSVPVYLALFQFYLKTGRPKEVEALFPQALQNTNNDVRILEAQDGFYEGSGRWRDAQAVVAKIQLEHAQEPAYWGVLGQFYVRTNQLTRARDEFERVLREHKDDLEDLHKLIEVHLDLNDRAAAEALNNALLKKSPEDNYAHLLKGRLALADGNVELASTEFNRAMRFRADWPAVHFWIAQVHVRRGQLQQAMQELDTALMHAPDYRAARLELADLENRTGAVASALLNEKRLLEANPHDLQARLVYSQSLLLKKDYHGAEKILQAAAGEAAGSADLHRQLGILELVRQNIPAAHKEFRMAWELQPSSRQLLDDVNLGYIAEHQAASGIQFLREAVARRPDDAALQFELARLYLWQGQETEAIAALQAAMKLAPANPESDVLLAGVYASRNNAELAAGILADAMRKSGINAELLVRAGMVYEKLQRWEDARKAYERSLMLDDSSAIAKNNLASVLADHGGDLNLALALAQQAKEKLGNSVEITSTLGWIYYKRQIYPVALQYLSDCAKKDPQNATFQYQLAMTQWKLGHTAEARTLLKKALALNAHFPEAAEANSALSRMGPG